MAKNLGAAERSRHRRESGEAYTVLVPAADALGNHVAGIRPPMLTAPLGTYTGWNLRGPGHSPGRLFPFNGAYIPLPETAEEASLTGDPLPIFYRSTRRRKALLRPFAPQPNSFLPKGSSPEAGLGEFVTYARG